MLLVPKIQTEWTQVDTGSMRAEVSVKIFSNQDHQELTRLLDNGDMPSKCIFQACSSRVSCCSFSFSASLFRFPPLWCRRLQSHFELSFNRFQRSPFAAKACANRPCHGTLSPLAQQPCNIQMQWKYAQITKKSQNIYCKNLRNIQFPIIVISCHSQFSTKYP